MEVGILSDTRQMAVCFTHEYFLRLSLLCNIPLLILNNFDKVSCMDANVCTTLNKIYRGTAIDTETSVSKNYKHPDRQCFLLDNRFMFQPSPTQTVGIKSKRKVYKGSFLIRVSRAAVSFTSKDAS